MTARAAAVLALALGGGLPVVARASAPPPPRRVLFVGNSYTYYNGGLDVHVRGLALTADPATPVETARAAVGGYTLADHAADPATLAAIAGGGFDAVVLQEQSTRPVTNPDLMYAAARALDDAIAGSGARTAFFMTWARASDPAMIEPLAHAYGAIGIELDADVGPVGRAFAMALAAVPSLPLHDADASHPSSRGTYLAACVLYATLWHRSPVGLAYVNDPAIVEPERTFLQTVAWQAVERYTGIPGTAQDLVLTRRGGDLVFAWSAPPLPCNAVTFAVYAGNLGALRAGGYAHDTRLGCDVPDAELALAASDPRLGTTASYFLVVPATGSAEGSYGRTGTAETPASAAACRSLLDTRACR